MSRSPRWLWVLTLMAFGAAACSEPAPLDEITAPTTTSPPEVTAEPSLPPDPTTTLPPTTTTEPEPAFAGLMFERAEGDDLVDDRRSATVRATVSGGDLAALAVGDIVDPTDQLTTAVGWIVDDPADESGWTPIDIASDDPVTPTSMTAATASEAGWVAVGTAGTGAARIAAVWRISADGSATRLETSGFEAGVDVSLDAIVYEPAVGFTAIGTIVSQERSVPTVWTSSDAQVWARIDLDSPDPIDRLGGLAATAGGVIVVGTVIGPDSSRDGAAWIVDDATAVPDNSAAFSGPGDQELLGVTVLDGNAVAVGSIELTTAQTPASWVRTDGVWSAPQTAFEGRLDGRITSDGHGATGAIADGPVLYTRSTSTFLAQVWQSTNGTEWSVVGDLTGIRPDGVAITSLAVATGQLMAVTAEPGALVWSGAQWLVADIGDNLPHPSATSSTTSVAFADGVFVAVGARELPASGAVSSANLGMAWTSTDGATWTADQASLSAGPVFDIDGADGRGFVAVGREDPASIDDRNATALAWTSPDGQSWEPVDLAFALPANASSLLETVALTPRGFIAGGWVFAGSDVDALLISYEDGQVAAARVDLFGLGLDGPGDQIVTAVCARDGGAMVAFVSTETNNGTSATALFALDRQPWSFSGSADRSLETADRQSVDRCRYGGDDQWVALGSRTIAGETDAAIWRADGGTDWAIEGNDVAFAGPGLQRATGAIRLDGSWLIMGDSAADATPTAVVWAERPDGWEQLPPPTGLEAPGVTLGGVLATSGGLIVATGSDIGRAGLWYTPSGQTGGESPL